MAEIASRLIQAGFDYDRLLERSNLLTLGLDIHLSQVSAAINHWGYALPDVVLPLFAQGLQGELITQTRIITGRTPVPITRTLMLVAYDLGFSEDIFDLFQEEYIFSGVALVSTRTSAKALVLATLLQPDFMLVDTLQPDWDALYAMRYLMEYPGTRQIRLGYLHDRHYQPPAIPYPEPCFAMTKPVQKYALLSNMERCFWYV